MGVLLMYGVTPFFHLGFTLWFWVSERLCHSGDQVGRYVPYYIQQHWNPVLRASRPVWDRRFPFHWSKWWRHPRWNADFFLVPGIDPNSNALWRKALLMTSSAAATVDVTIGIAYGWHQPKTKFKQIAKVKSIQVESIQIKSKQPIHRRIRIYRIHINRIIGYIGQIFQSRFFLSFFAIKKFGYIGSGFAYIG